MPRHPPPEITQFKSLNQRKLVECARLMFGEYWLNPLAGVLDKNIRQIHRWAHGEYEPPDEIVEQLAVMARRRAAALMRAANRG